MYEMMEQVKVRKYEVDIEKLKEVLKRHRQSSGLSCKKISEAMNVKKTTVEHWFRNDNCFSIPDEHLWESLKQLLGITTTEFDASITEFIIRDGVYEKSGRVYDADGIAPTLTTSCHEKVIIFD